MALKACVCTIHSANKCAILVGNSRLKNFNCYICFHFEFKVKKNQCTSLLNISLIIKLLHHTKIKKSRILYNNNILLNQKNTYYYSHIIKNKHTKNKNKITKYILYITSQSLEIFGNARISFRRSVIFKTIYFTVSSCYTHILCEAKFSNYTLICNNFTKFLIIVQFYNLLQDIKKLCFKFKCSVTDCLICYLCIKMELVVAAALSITLLVYHETTHKCYIINNLFYIQFYIYYPSSWLLKI